MKANQHLLVVGGTRRKPANRKLGHLVASFSIPAGYTCPGETGACAAKCYAKGFLFRLQSERHAAFLEATREPDFVGRVVREIRRDAMGVVRPHVAGDYYSVEYLGKWIEIARKCPKTTFFSYTRSWRDEKGINPVMVAALAEYAALPNVHLWFSEDRDTGRSPRVEGVRVAFTVFRKGDEALVPDTASVVFRDSRTIAGPAKRINGVQVCPHEDGVERKVGKLTCSACKICFSAARS